MALARSHLFVSVSFKSENIGLPDIGLVNTALVVIRENSLVDFRRDVATNSGIALKARWKG